MRASSAARRARISGVPSLLPPSATRISSRSRGYVCAWTLRRHASMKPASFRQGMATLTKGRVTPRRPLLPAPVEHHDQRPEQDHEVQVEGLVLDVVEVVLQLDERRLGPLGIALLHQG